MVFRFLGETNDLKRATGQAEKGIGGIGGAMRKVAGLAAGAFAVGQIIDFGRASIEAASDYNESVNAVEVATGEASDAILALGDVSAETYGLSRTQINEAAVALDGFLEKLNQPQEEAFEDIIGRATDFASVMNLDVDDALGKFQSALAGESEPLRKFGLDMSAASVSAYAVAEGLHATGKNMTEAEKVAARYSLLMQQTDDFQGDFANTADSAANQAKILEARLSDLQIQLGQKLLPAYEDLLGVAVDIAPALGGVIDVASLGIGPFTDLAEVVSDTVDGFEGMNDLLPATESLLRGAGNYIRNQWFPGVEQAATAWREFTLGVEDSEPTFAEFGSSAEAVGRALDEQIAQKAKDARVDVEESADQMAEAMEKAKRRVDSAVGQWIRILDDLPAAYARVAAEIEAQNVLARPDPRDVGPSDLDEYYRNNNGYGPNEK